MVRLKGTTTLTFWKSKRQPGIESLAVAVSHCLSLFP